MHDREHPVERGDAAGAAERALQADVRQLAGAQDPVGRDRIADPQATAQASGSSYGSSWAIVNAHIWKVNRTTSRVFVRGLSTAIASGPAATVAAVAQAGIRNRLRASGTAIAAATVAPASARTVRAQRGR